MRPEAHAIFRLMVSVAWLTLIVPLTSGKHGASRAHQHVMSERARAAGGTGPVEHEAVALARARAEPRCGDGGVAVNCPLRASVTASRATGDQGGRWPAPHRATRARH
jgi:hypothetical protein